MEALKSDLSLFTNLESMSADKIRSCPVTSRTKNDARRTESCKGKNKAEISRYALVQAKFLSQDKILGNSRISTNINTGAKYILTPRVVRRKWGKNRCNVKIIAVHLMDPFWGNLWSPHNATEGPETHKNNYKTENVPLYFVRHQHVFRWSLHSLWSFKILNNTTVGLGCVSESPIGFSRDKLCQNCPKMPQIDQKLSTFHYMH